MSDIAMLVAEEYERRTKNFKKAEGQINVVASCASLLDLAQRLKGKEGVEKRELPNWVWEPKTQFAIAASTSFFSA